MSKENNKAKPDSVVIMGRDCQVLWDVKISSGDFGYYTPGECKIEITKNNVGKELPIRTLLHEMTHAALDVSGVSYILGSGSNQKKVEESLCTVIEQLIYPNIEMLYNLKQSLANTEQPAVVDTKIQKKTRRKLKK